jgi:ribosomal protein S12 methylthiotransferase accessory factor
METPKRSFRKIAGTQRTLHAEDTLHRVHEAARNLGVTRLADITGLDHVGIPTYSAVVPASADAISVYTGKGLCPVDAKVGALMEAIERQTILRERLPLLEGTIAELRQANAILDPRDLKEKLCAGYSEKHPYSWIFGTDLMSGRDILVPAKFAGYLWNEVPHPPCFEHSTTDGMASGNIREEAICQALCELIERDAWTMAEIGAHLLPWARRRVVDPRNAENGPDDFEMFPCLDLEDDPVVELFNRAGLHPVLHDITSDLGIPTIFAAIPDEMLPGFPMVHFGLGAHPDARVAARRALTEAAQSRCVDIQGVREDIVPAASAPTVVNLHSRRIEKINRQLWILGESKVRRRLSDISSVVHDDIQMDVEHILSRLKARGIGEAIVVDFTPPGAPFAVVRVIVPELETWSVCHGPLGRRALNFWRSHV